MIQSDYHVHSSFSGDCKVDMEIIIKSAIEKNVNNLCFTDHHDLDFPYPDICFELDIDSYYKRFIELKEKYKNHINLCLGIELGIQPHLYDKLSQIVSSYPFDFVLASNHLAKGQDPYIPSYFESRTKYDGYLDYFEEILSNVKNYNDFDCYGHLDYVVRYGNFDNKKLEYNLFKDVLDEILITLINNNKGIELNTSGFRYGLNNPHPHSDVFRRYRELGGEIITIGSDSHKPEDLCGYFDKAKNILETLGFKYYTIYKNRKAEFFPL